MDYQSINYVNIFFLFWSKTIFDQENKNIIYLFYIGLFLEYL